MAGWLHWRQRGVGRLTPTEAKRLADYFRAGEDAVHSPQVQSMIDATIRRIHAEFARLPIRVVFTDRDPYASFEEMRDQVLSSGVLYIWTGASEVPMWDPKTNWMARAVHDWQHISDQFDFTLNGEYEGYRVAARDAPQLAPIYLSEIAMQAAVSSVYGEFAPEQKIVLLEPHEMKWAESLRGLGQYTDEAMLVQLTATMLSVMSPEEVAINLAVMGANEDSALLLIEAAQIYDAIEEGQMDADEPGPVNA